MLGNKVKPRDVFTPRAPDLNKKTYADRPELEEALRDGLDSHKYLIMHGESGNGKTWLYKRVFGELDMPFTVVNLAKMINAGSLNEVLSQKLGELGYKEQVSETAEADVGLKPAGVGAAYKHTFLYQGRQVGPVEAVAIQLQNNNKGKAGMVVLDNFEQIARKDDFVTQIAALIISADEDIIAKTGVKFMLVGTPNNIIELLSRVADASTIANRFVEVPEVSRLKLGEARYIMKEGFERHLKYTILVDNNELYKDINFKTDGIAQQVQELCLAIALEAEKNNGILNRQAVIQAEKKWLTQTLKSDQAAVLSHMNSTETKVGRKDQTIYCLARMPREDFRHTELEEQVRKTFSVPENKMLNIPQILADFQKGPNPIVRKSALSNHFSVRSPKYRMAIRSMLFIDDNGKVKVK